MKEKLTTIELFSGIGAQKRGIDLTSLFDCEVIATSDIDKESTVSYATIHNGLTNELIDTYKDYPSEKDMKAELIDKNIGIDLKKGTNPITRLKGKRLKRYWLAMKLSNNLGDISKINQLPCVDFWTYSFPCTDISLAGKQEGIVKNKTRSGLLYEVERLLEVAKKDGTLPKYLMLENVKNLVGEKFKPQFDEWLNRLDELGFNTRWQVINGKNCGIAQNRERVFAISIRKDADTGLFDFPKPFDVGYRLRDFLEDEVDKKYYISQEGQDGLQLTDDTFTKSLEDTNELKQAMVLSGGKWDRINESCRRVYSEDGIAPTLHTCGGGNTEVKVVFEERRDAKLKSKQGFGRMGRQAVDTYNKCRPKYGDTINPFNKTVDPSGFSPTLTTRPEGFKTAILLITNDYRIRKLTPRECWRLMGFKDEDINKCYELKVSGSQLYKQAGNSIITYCIRLLMEHLYKAQYDNTYACTDERILNEND